MKKVVSVIIVNYNGLKYLEPCFNSLFKVDKDNLLLDVIMVDNLSNDGSINFVKEKFPEIEIIENDINNYAKALNLGIEKSKGDYIAILNNDTTVEKNWLRGLMAAMDRDERIGAIQSKILFSDGKTINSAGVEEVEDFYFRDIGFDEKDVGKYEEEKEQEYFSGGSVLLRRGCVESVGNFDEDFVMYMEDIDYSIRCRDKGWKIFYAPKSVTRHRYHGTASSDLCEYFCSRNRLLLLGKRFPLSLSQSIKTSHFYLKNEFEPLYHSLIQAVKKLIEHNDTETSKKALDALREVAIEIFGRRKAYNFFTQLEVVLGLRKIRVGIYDHAFHFAGGGQRYVAKLAESLQDRYDITYIANKEVSLNEYKEWFDIDLSRCKLKIIKIPFYERLGRYFIDEGMVINEDINPFDVISEESCQYDIFINANMLGKVEPLSSLSIFMCHFPDRNKEKFFSVDQYDYLITNSNYTTFWVKKRWGLDNKLRLYPPVDMYNGVDEIVNKHKIILSVARFELGGSKKQVEMVKAFGDLCKKNRRVEDEWKLILAGGTPRENPYFDEVRREVDSFHGADIELMPNLTNSELKGLYGNASLFWNACGLGETDPHLIEHFGMTTVEAMQNYCVPIVIDGGGQREIVEHGISGFRFKTIEELESYTLKVINDEKSREEIARKSYERSQCFTSTIFRKNVLEFFSDVENRLRGGEDLEVRSAVEDSETTSLYRNNIDKIPCYWDEHVKLHEDPSALISWLDSPLVQEHCLKKLRVRDKLMSVTQWVLWAKEKYVPFKLNYGLSLGCGDGTLERHAILFNICSKFGSCPLGTESFIYF